MTVFFPVVMPDSAFDLPPITPFAPTMSPKKPAPGDAIDGISMRTNVHLTSAGVIGLPFENLIPD